MTIKSVILNGNNIHNLDTFYDETNRALNPLNDGFGRNLDALVDLLYGGYGIHDMNEQVSVKWVNSEKNRKELGDRKFDQIVQAIKSVKNVHFELEP